MDFSQDQLIHFTDLCSEPSLARFLDELSDTDFEKFIGFVFQQAGYQVEHTGLQFGYGLDLKLSNIMGTEKVGVSIKHFAASTLVTGPQLMNLRGALNGSQGAVVTTSKLNNPAFTEALKHPQIWTIDGEHLLRYIQYVRGSRPNIVAEASNSFPAGYPLTPVSPNGLFLADAIRQRTSNVAKKLVFANHKGGVGKTTSALNFAFGLAKNNDQILLIDMDGQANLTRALGNPQGQHAAPLHIGDFFTGKRKLADLIRPTQFERVWLIPSHPSLSLSDTGIAAGPEAELRFVEELHSATLAPPHVLDARPFDWIILDTGPSFGYFTRSALASAHYVIMPIAPGMFADLGLGPLQQTVLTMQALTNTPIKFVGCLVTQWKDDAINKQLLNQVKTQVDAANVPLIQSRIPYDKANIEKAHLETGSGHKKNLFSKQSPVAQAYTQAIEEVITYVK